MSYALPAQPISLAETPRVRRITTADLREALQEGIGDFREIPTQLVFLCLLYPVIGLVAARMATGDLLPLLFPLVTGLSLLGPVLAVGMYELSRRRESGAEASWLNAFDVIRSPAIVGIVALGLVLLFIFGLWIGSARAIYLAAFGAAVPESVAALGRMVLHSGAGVKLLLVGNIVGFGFAVLVLAISAVSFPMMLDRHCSPVLAVQTSLRVVARNPRTMAVWGLMVAGLLALGSIPFFVGLAVVMPVLGHATWHVYRRAVF